jgi:hypothetical protein
MRNGTLIGGAIPGILTFQTREDGVAKPLVEKIPFVGN